MNRRMALCYCFSYMTKEKWSRRSNTIRGWGVNRKHRWTTLLHRDMCNFMTRSWNKGKDRSKR